MRVPKLALPILVVIALFGGFFLRSAFTQPSTSISTGASGSARVECVVDGVKCKGTASLFTSHIQDVPGISTIETFAADHKVIMTYDPAIITPDQIRDNIDSPVTIDDNTHVAIFRCVSIESTDSQPETP